GRVFVVLTPEDTLVWMRNEHIAAAMTDDPPFAAIVKDACDKAAGPLALEPEPLNSLIQRADAFAIWTVVVRDSARQMVDMAADAENRGLLIIETVPTRLGD